MADDDGAGAGEFDAECMAGVVEYFDVALEGAEGGVELAIDEPERGTAKFKAFEGASVVGERAGKILRSGRAAGAVGSNGAAGAASLETDATVRLIGNRLGIVLLKKKVISEAGGRSGEAATGSRVDDDGDAEVVFGKETDVGMEAVKAAEVMDEDVVVVGADIPTEAITEAAEDSEGGVLLRM